MEAQKVQLPRTLYDICLSEIVGIVFEVPVQPFHMCSISILPTTVFLDVYQELFNYNPCFEHHSCFDLNMLNALLQVKGKRFFLLKAYQTLLNHGHHMTEIHLDNFKDYISNNQRSREYLIDMGLRMGEFLKDGGWLWYSIIFLDLTAEMLEMETEHDTKFLPKLLQLYGIKLQAECLYCNLYKADVTYGRAEEVIKRCEHYIDIRRILPDVYCSMSTYHFIHSCFEGAYLWAIKALELLPSGLSKRTTIRVLRQASKSCVVRRKFLKARLLICEALLIGDTITLEPLPTYSDIMMDYAFFLLNSDEVARSVTAYKDALKHRIALYQSDNLNIAIAYEDLSYALYVSEYNTGNFWEAKHYSKSAMHSMGRLLPKNHFYQASAKRVKALIFEEIALDSREDDPKREELFKKAEDLHYSALQISIKLFGKKNVQTAKHYGNLGRLYQSMGRLEIAEVMHKKAISIKEELLGPEDYEVGLSLGHLASLYNYHMKDYLKAEGLYFRSININVKIFGLTYSGLEYDFRGLVNLYENTLNVENAIFYKNRLRQWKNRKNNIEVVVQHLDLMSPEDIVNRFFEIREEEKELRARRADLAKLSTHLYMIGNHSG